MFCCLPNLIESITHPKVLMRYRNCMCMCVILHLELRGLGRIIYNQCNIHLGINQVKHTQGAEHYIISVIKSTNCELI